jgi:hypothetical protein
MILNLADLAGPPPRIADRDEAGSSVGNIFGFTNTSTTEPASNVVKFERPPPELQFCELRLHNGTHNLHLTLVDELGNKIPLEYAIISKPETFDLARLSEAWSRWRGCTGTAS